MNINKTINLLSLIKANYSKNYNIIPIPNYFSKSYRVYCSMKADLELSLNYLSLIEAIDNNLLRHLLYVNIISLYSRCFIDSTTSKSPKLEYKQIFINNEDIKTTHNNLIEIRHNFISHKGNNNIESDIAYILYPKIENLQMELKYLRYIDNEFEKLDIKKIEELILYVKEKVIVKMEDKGKKLYNGFFKKYDSEQISIFMSTTTLPNIM